MILSKALQNILPMNNNMFRESRNNAHQVPTFIVVLVATPMALVWLPKVETA
jgi:hypothetical protein